METNITKYGIAEYINEERSVVHILTQDSIQVFHHYEGENNIPVGSFVKFKQYEKEQEGEIKIKIAHAEPCSEEEALAAMRSSLAVVDEVNEEMRMFHVVIGKRRISYVFKFKQTDLRPSPGDMLRVWYLSYINHKGQKRIKILAIKQTDEQSEYLKRAFEGVLILSRKDGRSQGEPTFGFVGDYYVPRNLLEKHDITSDCIAKGIAVAGSEGKWKAIELSVDKASCVKELLGFTKY
jgi:hypothetical protein